MKKILLAALLSVMAVSAQAETAVQAMRCGFKEVEVSLNVDEARKTDYMIVNGMRYEYTNMYVARETDDPENNVMIEFSTKDGFSTFLAYASGKFAINHEGKSDTCTLVK